MTMYILDPNAIDHQALLGCATHRRSAGVFEAIIVGKQSKSLTVRIVPGLTGRNLHRNRPDGVVVQLDVKKVQRFCRVKLAIAEKLRQEAEK